MVALWPILHDFLVPRSSPISHALLLVGLVIAVGLGPLGPSGFGSSDAYIVERVEHVNGKNYTIREEQPYYRVYHPPHYKVFRPNVRIVTVNATERAPAAQKTPTGILGFNLFSHHNQDPANHKSSLFDLVASKIASLTASISGGGGEEHSEAIFGHHHLPPGERRNDAKWPDSLTPYVKCMDLACQCPFFNGTAVGAGCLLPDGRRLERALRKDYRQYTREERAEFLSAMWGMKKDAMYTAVATVHRRGGVHSGPSFLPWHREYLKRLEMIYRLYANGTRLGLPYWDSTLDNNLPVPKDSVMFSDALMGESPIDEYHSGMVLTGPFAYWAPPDGRPSFHRMLATRPDGEFINEARIDFVLNQTEINRVMAYTLPLHSCINYTMDERFLEYSHDYVHYYISGDMHQRYSSGNDPLFIMHHGFIDMVWEAWRQLRQTRHQREHDYPEDNGECMPVWHFSDHPMPLLELTNREGLSNAYTDSLYEYAPRPKCKERSSECDSEFLFCDTRSNPVKPICSTRVKLGGNCTGLEWSKEACYEGTCVEGLCRSSTIRVLHSDAAAATGTDEGKRSKGDEKKLEILKKSVPFGSYM